MPLAYNHCKNTKQFPPEGNGRDTGHLASKSKHQGQAAVMTLLQPLSGLVGP